MKFAVLVKNFLFTFFILSLFLFASPAKAAYMYQETSEPYNGLPLCAPGVYLLQPEECLPLGPSVYLTELARNGITLPIQPIPGIKPPQELSVVPYLYVILNTKADVPIYGSLDAAKAHSPGRYLPGGRIRYLSYNQMITDESGIYFQLRSGEWISAGEANTARAGAPYFQGFLFKHTPRNSFGWVLQEADVMQSPGYQSPTTGKKLQRFNLVQIYNVEEANNTEWFMIGMDEWFEKRLIARVVPDTTPPEGVEGSRWIEANLYEQTLMVYDNYELVFATLMSSGLEPFYTQPGLFRAYKKLETETMSGSFEADRSDYYYLQDVPWTIYYEKEFAIHGAYWHTLFGYPISHGCINLSIADARWIFDWIKEGDWVYIWDPSGLTPTDPKYYGAGGP